MTTSVGVPSAPQVNFTDRTKILEDWFLAAHRGELEKLQTILKLNSDIVTVNTQARPGGYTALLVAVEGGQAEVVEWLLEQGADIWLRCDSGELPRDRLMSAMIFSREKAEAILKLLEKKEQETFEPEKEQIEEIIGRIWKLAVKETPYTAEDKLNLEEVFQKGNALKYQNLAQRLNLIKNVSFCPQYLGFAIRNRHPELLEKFLRIPNMNPTGGEYDNSLVTACRESSFECLKLLLDSEKVDPSSTGCGNPISTTVYPLRECINNLWLGIRSGFIRDEAIKTVRVYIQHPRVPRSLLTEKVYGLSAVDYLLSLVNPHISSQDYLSDEELKGVMSGCLDVLERRSKSPEFAIVKRLYEFACKEMNDDDIVEAKELIEKLQKLQPENAWSFLDPKRSDGIIFGGEILEIASWYNNTALIEMLNKLKNHS